MIYLDFQKKLYSTQGEVLLKVQCSLKMRELITLFGKSGAGKTTILRILAGLTTPILELSKCKILFGLAPKIKLISPLKKGRLVLYFKIMHFFLI